MLKKTVKDKTSSVAAATGGEYIETFPLIISISAFGTWNFLMCQASFDALSTSRQQNIKRVSKKKRKNRNRVAWGFTYYQDARKQLYFY